MQLEDKIRFIEKYQEVMIRFLEEKSPEKSDQYTAYIDRIVSLQDTLFSLRKRKSFIDQNMIERGDCE